MPHPLFTPFTIKTITRNTKKEAFDFLSALQPLCTMHTVEHLLFFLRHVDLDRIDTITDISIFKTGIEPLWEDKCNIDGGKLIIKLRREVSVRLFERLLMAMVRAPFKRIDVNGLVISFRVKSVILALWTRNAVGRECFRDVMEEIKEVLGVTCHLSIEYKNNDESLRDNSSFRNAKNVVVS